jgi:trehalose-phosphatase
VVGSPNASEKRRIHGEQLFPVHIPHENFELYLSFCQQILWNLLHYNFSKLLGNDAFELQRGWEVYRDVNMRFAETICEVYEDGDMIWIHDYHFMLLPEMIRSRLWYAKIGIFIYTPFPSFEVFRSFPWRTELLSGLLGSSLVGFHNYDYSRHFSESCSRLLGTEGTPKGIEVRAVNGSGHLCEIGIYPYGIDVSSLRNLTNEQSVKSQMRSLQDTFSGKQVIVGLDRLDDEFAGIPLKLLAFYELLKRSRKWQQQVVFIEVAVATEHVSQTCLKQAEHVYELVGLINSEFGSFSFCPVHFVNRELSQEDICALLSVGDICVVSSTRDGISLVSYEWTLCQHSENHGVLVLSEFSGSALSFSSAQHVNPWNTDELVSVMESALCMSRHERKLRHDVAYDFVSTHTVKLWSNNFLQDLEEVEDNRLSTKQIMFLDSNKVVEAYQNAKGRRILFLDHGGTLAPFQSIAQLAGPAASVVRSVHRLALNPQNLLMIVCERDRATVSRWYQIPTFVENEQSFHISSSFNSFGAVEQTCEASWKPLSSMSVSASDSYNSLSAMEDFTIPNAGSKIGLGCEDGFFIRCCEMEQWEEQQINACKDVTQWESFVLPILQNFAERTPGSVIERGEVSLTWYYQDSDPDFGEWQARELHKHLESIVVQHLPLDIVLGDERCRWLKIRPNGVKKYVALEKMLEKISYDFDFLLCIGDDRSDEETFEWIRNKEYAGWDMNRIFTCKVGRDFHSNAMFMVNSYQDVANLLDQLIDGTQ